MLSNVIIRSTAAFGGTPFRLSKCTALASAGGGAAVAFLGPFGRYGVFYFGYAAFTNNAGQKVLLPGVPL